MWRRHAITFWSLSTYFFVGNKTATICSMVYCISFDWLLITHKESSSDDYQSIITATNTLTAHYVLDLSILVFSFNAFLTIISWTIMAVLMRLWRWFIIQSFIRYLEFGMSMRKNLGSQTVNNLETIYDILFVHSDKNTSR